MLKTDFSKLLFFGVFVFPLFAFLPQARASCALNEYIGNQCEPPQTQNKCSCPLCWKKWAIGTCNYNGDPTGTLMNSEGYACTYECQYTGGGGQDCPFCQGEDPACFLPGTKISTPTGQKNIETIKAGDKVTSFDPYTKQLSENVVGEVITTTKPSYYEITTKSGRVIRATAEHPFFVGFEKQNLSFVDKLSLLVKQLLSKIH